MSWMKRTFCSSIGLKMIMAVTGLALFLFLIAHLSGNLLTFAGAEAFNTYAAKLKSLGPLLWVARIGLLVVFATHVLTATMLTRKNRAARPQNYVFKDTIQASYASRTMMMSGVITLLFVLYHLAHFTFHWVGATDAEHFDYLGRHDAYQMLVLGFQNPVTSGLYVIAMLVLGMHLSHGLSSLFQSLGLNHPNFFPAIKKVAPLLAWAIVIGFISIPVAVLAGMIAL